jgi:hypothetical protein
MIAQSDQEWIPKVNEDFNQTSNLPSIYAKICLQVDLCKLDLLKVILIIHRLSTIRHYFKEDNKNHEFVY